MKPLVSKMHIFFYIYPVVANIIKDSKYFFDTIFIDNNSYLYVLKFEKNHDNISSEGIKICNITEG